MSFQLIKTTVATLALCLASTGLSAATLEETTGEVVLTVTGEISNLNAEGAATFDIIQLRALPQLQFSTTTIWTEGSHDFRGVPLQSILETVEGQGGILKVSAINDYSVEIPLSDIGPQYPIIAYEMDGQEMSVRNKGPLWIVFPYDHSADFQTEVVYSQSIWQLVSIDIVN